ncbi:MAG: hypothetical protein WDA16_05400 [Candidatus Thermoplasmatota archaeon]
MKYGADVPPAMVEVLEHHARNAGLSLETLEVIGASLDFVELFIVAAEQGNDITFLQKHGFVPPADNVGKARWQAQRLFGC